MSRSKSNILCIKSAAVAPGVNVGELNHPQMLLSPTVKGNGQESGGEFCGNFQILQMSIVSALKIYKTVFSNSFGFWEDPYDYGTIGTSPLDLGTSRGL